MILAVILSEIFQLLPEPPLLPANLLSTLRGPPPRNSTAAWGTACRNDQIRLACEEYDTPVPAGLVSGHSAAGSPALYERLVVAAELKPVTAREAAFGLREIHPLAQLGQKESDDRHGAGEVPPSVDGALDGRPEPPSRALG